jgi:putative oxygen-independent coproporphyrinogen III oxidase
MMLHRASAMLDAKRLHAFQFIASPPLTLYIHIPWCPRKCPYCDFNSYAARTGVPEARYIDALVRDLEQELPRVRGRCIEAVFIGGGTPSLFSAQAIDRLLFEIRARVPLKLGIEITLEANPGTVEQDKFRDFRAAGINRLSLGVQSFNDDCLKRLGRVHSAQEALCASEVAHACGFENFNIDLMFALPGRNLSDCLRDLRTAVALAPAHVSFYQLTIEPNTLFHAQPPRLPDDDLAWAMQTQGQCFLADRGYTQYEISAFARRGWQCAHNLNYWRFGDYLGLGAGAHGKVSSTSEGTIRRRWKYRQPGQYLDHAEHGNPVGGENELSADDAVFEFMLNALRLTEGFELDLFSERTGLPKRLIESPVREATKRGLLFDSGGHIGPTLLGKQFLDDATACFLPDHERVN